MSTLKDGLLNITLLLLQSEDGSSYFIMALLGFTLFYLFRVKDGPRAVSGQQPQLATMTSSESTQAVEDEVDFSEFLPDFQRVNISGEDNTGVRRWTVGCGFKTNNEF